MLFVKFQSAPYESIHEITRLWLQCWRISKARNLGKEILHSSCSQLQCWNQMRWLQCLWWNFIRIFILKEFLTEDSNRIDLNRISKNRQLYGILAFSRKFYQEMEAERWITAERSLRLQRNLSLLADLHYFITLWRFPPL